MSPSINQATPFQFLISRKAVWHPLRGLKPCERLENFGSRIHSRTILVDCWMILSRGDPIPRGLFFPLALGIYTLLAGLNLKDSFLSSKEVLRNQSLSIPSSVMLSVPSTMFPDLLLIFS
jgi:hypothetical protein